MGVNGDLIHVETPAAFGYRLLAFIADGIILTLVSSVLRALHLSSPELVVDAVYFWLLTALLGRTPGKVLMGIQLRSASGRIGFGTAFLREVLGKAIAFGTFGLGVLWIAIDSEKRGWHDFIAGTRAVRIKHLSWSPTYELAIIDLLATRPEVRPEWLTVCPDTAMRLPLLREFARRHVDEVAFDGGVLRPTGAVEWF